MHQRELSLQRHLVTQIAAAILASSGLCAYAAGDPLPKSGSASVHSGWNTAGQVKDLGEKHSVATGVHSGASFNDAGKGFLHKMVWSCPSATIINGGSYVVHGYCVITDADGDKIVSV